MSAAATAGPGVLRYMGNKSALLGPLSAAMAELAPDGSLVVDPMAGSHAVSSALKHRHRLLCSDAQHYSAVLGRAFVENTELPRIPSAYLARLRSEASARFASAPVGFLEEAYGDTYLGRSQCRQLDALRAAMEQLSPSPEDPRRWLVLCALMTAACRAQASPGHFAQYLQPEHPRTLKLREIDVFRVAFTWLESAEVVPGRSGSESLALPWRELCRQRGEELGEAAAWYLDPPYTRDQYSRFYHFLETLVRGDRPTLRHRARYREDRFRSAFCSSRAAATELADLFAAIAEHSPRAKVLLSYSCRGLLSREALLAAAAPTHSQVFLRELAHEYSTQGKGKLRGITEILVGFAPHNERVRRRERSRADR